MPVEEDRPGDEWDGRDLKALNAGRFEMKASRRAAAAAPLGRSLVALELRPAVAGP
jgi:hypothetical protein